MKDCKIKDFANHCADWNSYIDRYSKSNIGEQIGFIW